MVNLLKSRINQIKADTRYIGMQVTTNQLCDAVEVTIVYYRRYNNIYCTQNIEVWVVKDATDETYLDDTKVAYRMTNTISSNVARVFNVFKKPHRRWMRW